MTTQGGVELYHMIICSLFIFHFYFHALLFCVQLIVRYFGGILFGD
jgi:hypothetical protein